jgi:hypothetical protein
VSVLEIAPPWVQTDLLGRNNEPRAMPLAEFIEETIKVLGKFELRERGVQVMAVCPGPRDNILKCACVPISPGAPLPSNACSMPFAGQMARRSLFLAVYRVERKTFVCGLIIPLLAKGSKDFKRFSFFGLSTSDPRPSNRALSHRRALLDYRRTDQIGPSKIDGRMF